MGVDVSQISHQHRGNGESLRRCLTRRRQSRRCFWASILGVAAHLGRDKVTIVASPGISDLGAWLEQFIAESTGKLGKGIIPVDREPLAKPDSLRQRPRLRLSAPRNRAQQIPGFRHRRSRSRRTSRRAHHRRRYLQPRPGIFPLGNCHRRCRCDHRHQRLQSTGRRSQQNRNQEINQRIRKNRQAARRIALLRRRRHQALRRRKKHRRLKGRPSPRGSLESASRPPRRRRLFRAARLHHHERRQRESTADHSPRRPRQQRKSPPCSASARAFCTPPVRPTKADPTAASFCRSPATTPSTFRSRTRNILLAS